MVKPIADLTSFSENACFLNYNFLHRSADYSWLKLYVLLYDFLVFDSRNTLAMPLDWNLEAWEWLKKNSLYLEDFTEYKTHIELKEFGNQLLKQFAFRKSKISDPMEWVYNKNFLSTFFKKMRRRGDGESNQSDWFEYLPLNPEYWEAPRIFSDRFNTIIMNELLDTYKSGRVLYTTGIPSVLDSLGSWLLLRVFQKSAENPPVIGSLEKIVLKHIPNFNSISWKNIIDLRSSRFRKRCVKKLRQIEKLNSSVDDEIQKEFWRLATEVSAESSIGKAVLKGVAGNLPFLPANPFSLTYAGIDINVAKKRLNKFGWLFFISELHKVGNTN